MQLVRRRRSRTTVLFAFAVCAAGFLAALAGASSSSGSGGGAAAGSASAAAADQLGTVDRTGVRASASEFDKLAAIAERKGEVKVIVGLQLRFTPQGLLSRDARAEQLSGIDEATAEIRGALGGNGVQVVHTYETVPYIALVLSANALDRLEASGLAATLQRDVAEPATLAESTRIVEATEARAVGRNGNGQTIAILDTGVDKAHPFLAGKVVSEACYSANGNCPGGGTSSTAVGSGVPCTYAPVACRHGTHVAGIAAGDGTSFDGVAPGADLIAIQVFSRFTGAPNCGTGEDPCALSFTSDQLKGLERVFALRNTFDISSVNISIGGGSFTSTCDTDSRKPAVDNLISVGTATAIASGNDGFGNAVSAPGCISTAITVGATDDTDAVAGFSNSSAVVDLFAPGVNINSSVPGGGFANFNGTSMATPHVAGAWAVAKQSVPTASVGTVEATLDGTGLQVTDTAANPDITRARIRVFSTAAELKQTGLRARTAYTRTGVGGVVSDGAGFARRDGGPGGARNLVISGIPAGGQVVGAHLVWMTIGGPDSRVVFEGATAVGRLVGGGPDPCWNVGGVTSPVRTYEAKLPVADVPGNGTYTVSGVGAGAIDGEGASLVVVWRDPGGTRTHRTVVNVGALTARGGGFPSSAANHKFTGLNVPSAVVGNPTLNVGMADGQSFTEPPMRFDGSPITAANPWAGADGDFWDDRRIVLSPSLLPAGTTSRTVVQPFGGADPDCLAWAYAALSYRN